MKNIPFVYLHLITCTMLKKWEKYFDEGRYDEVVKMCTMSLIDSEHNDYQKYVMIDKVLEVHCVSNEVFDWLKNRYNPKVDVVLAKIYLQKEMYTECLDILRSNTTGEGLCILGKMYKDGLGVEADIKKAIECFESSENRWNMEAMYLLGTIYEKKEYNTAIEYYTKSAEFDYPEAQLRLGQIYEEKGNQANSLFYYIECADHGHKDACMKLATYYESVCNIDRAIHFCEKVNGDFLSNNIKMASLYRQKYHKISRQPFNSAYDFNVLKTKSHAVHRKLIDTDDADILYHLALITTDNESKHALYKCAKTGYLPALELYGYRYNSMEHHLIAATEDYVPSLYELGKDCLMDNKYQEAIVYFNRGIELLSSSGMTTYVFHDNRGSTDIKLLIDKESAKLYSAYKPNNLMKMVKYYLNHNFKETVSSIMYSNREFLDSVFQSVYIYKKLKNTCDDVLLPEYRDIKKYVEIDTGSYGYIKNMIGHVKIHFEYQRVLVGKMRETLDRSSLYVKTLHDVIANYIE